MYHIPSYPSIYAIGHKAINNIFTAPVKIQSKIDGSQISFCKINGEYFVRSKGKDIILDAPEKLFTKAIEVIKTLDLEDGWIYRGEFLSKPKHNTLCYSRIPQNHIILFDIEKAPSDFLSYEELIQEGKRINLEVVEQFFEGMVDNFEHFNSFLDKEDQLGGTKIEGIVIKSTSLFTQEKKIAMGKYVSEAFREVHQKEWKKSNPTQTDIIQGLIIEYKTNARWNKSIQHLKEIGQLENSPKDIGKIILEIPQDVLKEEEENIKQKLFDHFWPHIKRGVVAGLPDFYKKKLAEESFNQ